MDNHGSLFLSDVWRRLVQIRPNMGLYIRKVGGFVLADPFPFTPYVSLMESWMESVREADRVRIPLLPNTAFDSVLDYLWDGWAIMVDVTFILHFEGISERDIWDGLDPSRKRSIKRARKDGIHVSCPEDTNELDELISLYEKTFMRQRRKPPYPDLCMKIMRESMRLGMGKGWVAREKGGAPIAFVFIVWDERWAYYLFGGYDHERKHHGAGALAMWEAIRFLHRKGLRGLDFEGSHIRNIARYFKGFGARPVPYYVLYRESPRMKLVSALREMFRWT